MIVTLSTRIMFPFVDQCNIYSWSPLTYKNFKSKHSVMIVFKIIVCIFLFLAKADSFAPAPILTRLNHQSSLVSNERYMSNEEGNTEKPYIENVLLVECGKFTLQKKISLDIAVIIQCQHFHHVSIHNRFRKRFTWSECYQSCK